MTVKEIVAEWLKANGYGGLCNTDIDCGCELADLMPCDSEGCDLCEPAYRCDPDCKNCDATEHCAIAFEGAEFCMRTEKPAIPRQL